MKKKETVSLSTREYKKDDKDKLDDLIRERWGEKKLRDIKERLNHIIHNNPNLNPEIPAALVLEDNGRIVGFMTFIAAVIKIKENKYRICWVTDFFVAAGYRGKGGKLLARECSRFHCIQSGLPGVRVIPFWKTIWRRNYPVDIFDLTLIVRFQTVKQFFNIIKVNNLIAFKLGNSMLKMFNRLVFKIKCPRNIVIERIRHFDDRFNRLFDQVADRFPIIVVRDKKYLNWRYTEFPSHTYHIMAATRNSRLTGYIILRCKEKNGIKNGYIVDILAGMDDGETIAALVCHAEKYFQQKGVDNIKCLEFFNRSYKRKFQRMGFFRSSRPLNRLLFFNAYFESLDPAIFMNPTNWFITLNYSDQEMDI